MLILTRKPDQIVMIGKDIRVRVVGVEGNQVRIGIEAPKEIPVDREEIYLRKQQSQPSCQSKN